MAHGVENGANVVDGVTKSEVNDCLIFFCLNSNKLTLIGHCFCAGFTTKCITEWYKITSKV